MSCKTRNFIHYGLQNLQKTLPSSEKKYKKSKKKLELKEKASSDDEGSMLSDDQLAEKVFNC